jgi:hypothetical protein
MIDLTVTARQDGTEDADGMRLGELERTLAAIRRNGGTDDTMLDVRTNREHRIRSVTALDLDDESADGNLLPPVVEPTFPPPAE